LRRDGRFYTKGEVNAVIDALVHPWIKRYPWLVFVDGVLHALNEQNPEKSLQKFLKYNVKPLIDGLQKELRRQVERQVREALRV